MPKRHLGNMTASVWYDKGESEYAKINCQKDLEVKKKFIVKYWATPGFEEIAQWVNWLACTHEN